MRTIQHILVPIDFGSSSLAALGYALSLAAKFAANVTLLHVSWVPPLAYAAYAEGFDWPVEEVTQAAEDELRLVLRSAQSTWPNTDAVIEAGEPSHVITDCIAKRHIDLIVMGTHGRRGVSRLFLGSVAEKVVRLATVPVFTVSAKADEELRPTVAPERADQIEGTSTRP